mmetsp:Transcript_50391/g.155819  ORF Transcript_50391/g.155819 Transcript_50391/m.155819 type:complete len:201 (-) Transcript_50391:97-699(-)
MAASASSEEPGHAPHSASHASPSAPLALSRRASAAVRLKRLSGSAHLGSASLDSAASAIFLPAKRRPVLVSALLSVAHGCGCSGYSDAARCEKATASSCWPSLAEICAMAKYNNGSCSKPSSWEVLRSAYKACSLAEGKLFILIRQPTRKHRALMSSGLSRSACSRKAAHCWSCATARGPRSSRWNVSARSAHCLAHAMS